jgi:hypothetical protein
MSLGALTQVQECHLFLRPLLMTDNARVDQMFPNQATQDTEWTLLWRITKMIEEPLVTVFRNQEWTQQGNSRQSTGTARCLLCLKDMHRTNLTQLIRYNLSPLHTMIKQLPRQGLLDPTVRLPHLWAEAANQAIQLILPPRQVIPFPPPLRLPVLPCINVELLVILGGATHQTSERVAQLLERALKVLET